jgi:hypothetical protein
MEKLYESYKEYNEYCWKTAHYFTPRNSEIERCVDWYIPLFQRKNIMLEIRNKYELSWI